MKNTWLLLLAFPVLLGAQTKNFVSTDPAYIRNVEAGDAFFEMGSFGEAIPHYLRALHVSQAAFRTAYRLATCYLRLREFASASFWLQKCADQHPGELCEMVLDEGSELYRFRPLLDWHQIQVRCVQHMPRFNFPVKKELEEIRYFDQLIRKENKPLNEADCAGSTYYWPGMSFHQVDSVNEVRLEGIIAKVGGYPGLDVVGASQKNTAWLVIQHAPIAFQERYYPLVEQAADEGQIALADWAYLVDRMRMNRGEKQIYGSQLWLPDRNASTLYQIYPLEDPFHVNERRAAVGLGPIEDYIAGWGLKFEPEKMPAD